MPIDTSSPETAYCTKGNILLPKTDTRTAAAVQAVALTQESDGQPEPDGHRRRRSDQGALSHDRDHAQRRDHLLHEEEHRRARAVERRRRHRHARRRALRRRRRTGDTVTLGTPVTDADTVKYSQTLTSLG
jgi:hypothetical protein